MPAEIVKLSLYLCDLAEIQKGQARGFDPWRQGRDSVFVVRCGGEIKAYLNRCPHLAVSMEYRKDRFMSGDGQRIICYAHGAHFLPESGLCVFGPCLGERLTSLPCFVDSAGQVFLLQEKHPE